MKHLLVICLLMILTCTACTPKEENITVIESEQSKENQDKPVIVEVPPVWETVEGMTQIPAIKEFSGYDNDASTYNDNFEYLE